MKKLYHRIFISIYSVYHESKDSIPIFTSSALLAVGNGGFIFLICSLINVHKINKPIIVILNILFVFLNYYYFKKQNVEAELNSFFELKKPVRMLIALVAFMFIIIPYALAIYIGQKGK